LVLAVAVTAGGLGELARLSADPYPPRGSSVRAAASIWPRIASTLACSAWSFSPKAR
jgi:hypothetical protein